MTKINEYGKAMFLLTEELGSTETVKGDFFVIEQILKENPRYINLLDTPAVTKKEKLLLIDEAFSTLDENLRNLIKILAEKHLVFTFSDIKSTFISLYNEARGIEEVEAISAVDMSCEQISRLKEKLSAITGKRIIVNNTVNPEILGGLKLRYCGIQLDGSIKTRLDKFEKNLKNTII